MNTKIQDYLFVAAVFVVALGSNFGLLSALGYLR
jgi:hypothetical protein